MQSTTAEPVPREAGSRLQRLALLAILGLGLALRGYDLDFGLPDHVHPDEAVLFKPALHMVEVHDLYPHFFVYPALQMYVLAAAVAVDDTLWKGSEPPSAQERFVRATRIGRWITVLFDLATLLVVFGIGRELGSPRNGLLAALFFAIAPTPVLETHYLNVNTPLTFWCALSVWLLVRWQQRGRQLDFVLGAAAIGLAGATKYNGLTLGMALPAMVALRYPRMRLAPILGWTSLGGVICLAAFALGSPYNVLELSSSRAALEVLWAHQSSGHLGQDLAGGGGLYRHLVYQLFVGLPFVLGFGVYGLTLYGALLLTRRPVQRWLPLAAACLSILLPLALSQVVFSRYLMPMLPFLVLVAAETRTALIPAQATRARRLAGALVLATVLGYTGALTVSLLRNLTPHPPAQAAAWVRARLAPGTELAATPVAWFGLGAGVSGYPLSYAHLSEMAAGVERPRWLIVGGWDRRAFERGRLTSTREARFLDALGSPASPYELVAGFGADYFTEALYGLLDPSFRNYFRTPDMKIYRLRDP